MSSILPKGIVINTREISGDIQRIDREPLALEEIAKLWKVYTTTKRRLLDPTAERLENYWWRIWGSRKRNLKGAIVARLFEEISNGRSFVPLRGPPNRDESGGRPNTSISRGPGTASTTTIHSRPESDSSNGPQSSSASRNAAPMPPPILKKTRGPSSTGPRPTARFISPHGSEDDATGTSSTTSLGAHVIVRPPTPESQLSKGEKKVETATGPRRKVHAFVATTAGHKRRPGVVRRPNSDPPAQAHDTPQTAVPTKESYVSGLQHNPEQRKNSAKLQNQSKFQENFTPSPESRPTTKASRKTRSGKNGHLKASLGQSSVLTHDIDQEPTTKLEFSATLDEAGPSSKLRLIKNTQAAHSTQDGLAEEKLKGPAIHEGRLPKANAKLEQSKKATPKQSERQEPQPALTGQGVQAAYRESRSRSDGDKRVVQNLPAVRQFPKIVDSKSAISMGPTYTAAAGRLDVRNYPRGATIDDDGTSSLGKDKGRDSERPEQSPMFAKRPVQPVKAASALFSNTSQSSNNSISRSKSQLTLLLEKDRARSNEQEAGLDSAVPKERETERR